MTFQTPQSAVTPAGGGAGPNKTRKRRQLPRWAAASISAVLALFVGVGIGSTADPVNSSEYRALAETCERTTSDCAQTRLDLQGAEDDLESAHSQVVTLQADLDEAESSAAAALADMEGERERLDRREAELEEQSVEMAAAQRVLDEREGDVGSREAAVEVAGRESRAQPAPAGPYSGAFQNCSEARAAGAAPVYQGDPGYGPHLDRDNDGIGCE